jgi:CRISPR-associated endonuclease Csn1
MNIIRFAFDLGTNSIGWAVLQGQRNGDMFDLEDPKGAGVRIYSDGRNPKDGSSLAMQRRGPRAARRRRDRFLQRQRRLIATLITCGLMPQAEGARKALEKLDPYALRAKALDEKIAAHELGRAIFHLNQRRGFQSNRKTDSKEKEGGVIKEAQKRLNEALAQTSARSLGEFLHKRLNENDHARFRQTGVGTKAEHLFYPSRDMVKAEFNAIWNAQQKHHATLLTAEAHKKIFDALFHQRPLKKVKAGKCTFVPTKERMEAAYPSVEARRIYEDLNNLRYGAGLNITRSLDRTQRDLIATELLKGESFTWTKLRKALKFEASLKFSLEDHRDELKGCDTAKKLAGKSKRGEVFGTAWHVLSLERKDEIVKKLLETEDEAEVVSWLVADCGLDEEAAARVANTGLMDGHARLGPTANSKILAELIADHTKTYDKAVLAAGYHHSDFSPDKRLERLPYYAKVLERHVAFGTSDPNDTDEQRYGKFANPTVHVALNQFRKVFNALCDKYGKPDEVVIELARDLKRSKKEKEEQEKRNKENKQKNDINRAELLKQGVAENGRNMDLLKLWREQSDGMNSFCPYSGEQISLSQLFSAEIETDHILPYSRTLDDSLANKVVCFVSSNREKRNKTPFEFWGETKLWPAIEANAQRLPKSKRWRFTKEAMEKFEKEEGGFLARQLNETRHLARVAKTYVEHVSPQVWVVTGQLTAMLRGKWGLNNLLNDDNRKNRDDHRHHAIDAFTIGCISRGLLNELSKRAGRAEDMNDQRILSDIPEPFANFRDPLREILRNMVVSHKPDHGKQGALHEETNYGIVRNTSEHAIGNVVYRKSIDGLTDSEVDRVRDPVLRKKLQTVRDAVAGDAKKPDAKKLAAALLEWATAEAKAEEQRTQRPRNPIRHVRILKQEAANVPIAGRKSSVPYRAVVPAENWCMDIVSVPDGIGSYVWKGFAATIFDVNQKDWRPEWERNKIGGKLIMRLHKGDLVEIDDADGVRKIMKVVVISPANNRVELAAHNEAGELEKRHKDPDDGFRWFNSNINKMEQRGARKLNVNAIGNLKPSVG